jgi:hypothetical protein
MKQVFLDIQTELLEISNLKKVTIFNNQYLNTQLEQGYDYPIALIEFSNIQFFDLSKQIQQFEADIVIHLVYESYDFEPIAFYDIRDEILQKLQGFEPTNCSQLIRISEETDNDHDALYIYKISYRCTGTDITANSDTNKISHTVATLETTKDLEIDNYTIRTGII